MIGITNSSINAEAGRGFEWLTQGKHTFMFWVSSPALPWHLFQPVFSDWEAMPLRYLAADKDPQPLAIFNIDMRRKVQEETAVPVSGKLVR